MYSRWFLVIVNSFVYLQTELRLEYPNPRVMTGSKAGIQQTCPDCRKKFPTKTSLNLHRLKVHVADQQQPHPCPRCNQVCGFYYSKGAIQRYFPKGLIHRGNFLNENFPSGNFPNVYLRLC